MGEERLRVAAGPDAGWRRWGPYLAERQWGTVREHLGEGDPWTSFPHDHARSRAYRWGEDGLAGVSDDRQRLCLALALWNGRDPILKERLFGLTNGEGNHGEDVKECYFYLDATPTSSYLKMLYRYPHVEFPYADLVATNGRRTRAEPEYELIDTGVFDDGRYFDVVVEYAKADPEDLLMQVTVTNRGPGAATIHVLPTLWFRHTWSWAGGAHRPVLRVRPSRGGAAVVAEHDELGRRWLHCEGPAVPLLTGNETNDERVFGSPNVTAFVKDGIDRAVVRGDRSALDPGGVNTKVALHHVLTVAGGDSATVRLRLTNAPGGEDAFDDFDAVLCKRRREADEFWQEVLGDLADEERSVARQALAGLLWSRQYYSFDVDQWLARGTAGPANGAAGRRNEGWRHLAADDVVCMPDKWEYPWFAAWDLAFHAVALAPVDGALAKDQVELLLGDRYLHPNGQLPAYEWNFGDVNPPVHAWAALLVYEVDKLLTGHGDRRFLERVFHKLVRNFDWWLNRKDVGNRNVFGGGFLGLDNVGVFDRNTSLPDGMWIDQADATAWMALFCQNLAAMAVELGRDNDVYLDQARALLQNFLWIAGGTGEGAGLWCEGDGFFYDVLRRPGRDDVPLAVRSIVGLMPLVASTVVPGSVRHEFPDLVRDGADFLRRHPTLASSLPERGRAAAGDGPMLLALVDEGRLRRLLAHLLDEAEFLSPHGIRSLSRWHADHPYVIDLDGVRHCVRYIPGESDTGTFGGNSNWRGPVWFPVNVMLVRALLNLHAYFGDDFTVECPRGSGCFCTLHEVADEIARRLIRLFLPGADGRRPYEGAARPGGADARWREPLLFHEYFHGDTGTGLGAGHQTGWTALVALLPFVLGRGTARPLT